MHLNTGDHPPIKLKPYRTQLNKREVIDKAIGEMMETKIIQRGLSLHGVFQWSLWIGKMGQNAFV